MGFLLSWFAVTVSGPLLFFEATHRWEEDPRVGSVVWWTVAAAAFWTAPLAARRGLTRAALSGVLLVAATLGVFRYVVPLTGTAPWLLTFGAGAAAATAGALLGPATRALLGRRMPPLRRHGRTPGLVTGLLTVVAGVVLMPATIRLGAEGSTVGHEGGRYGPVGPVMLPRAGEYAVLAVGSASTRPDCTADGRAVDLLPITPGDYGSDAATYTWVGVFRVEAPGMYTVDCPSDDHYEIGDVPAIRGAVGRMIHWPLPVIWLLGALPGLAAIGIAGRRRTTPSPAGHG